MTLDSKISSDLTAFGRLRLRLNMTTLTKRLAGKLHLARKDYRRALDRNLPPKKAR